MASAAVDRMDAPVRSCMRMLICLLAISGVAAGQESPKQNEAATIQPGAQPAQRDDVRQFMLRIYDPAKAEHPCTATNPVEFAAWHQEAHQAFINLLKLDVIRQDAGEFQPVVTMDSDVEDLGTFTRQSGFLETEPSVRIQFWLLKPKGDGPFPVVITANGHGPSRGTAGIFRNEAERQKALAEDRDVGIQAVDRGYLAIVTSTRGIGQNPEAFGIEDIDNRNAGKDCVAHNWHVLMADRTMMGERVWDIMRFLDWIATLPYADTSTIIMTGNSGGGMLTQYAAAADPRITIAIPSSSFDNHFQPSGNLTHCQCNHVPGMVRFGQFWDIAGLIAPRPLLTVTGRYDPSHPVSEVTAAATHVKRIYTAAGVPDHYEHQFGHAGHRCYKDIMWDFVARAPSPASASNGTR